MTHARKPRATPGLQHRPSAPPATEAATDHAAAAKRLRERRQTLRREIHDTLRRMDSERYADIADRVSDIEDRPLAELLAEVSHAEIARDVEEAGDIETALERIAAGTYGLCLDCHARIRPERLTAYPTAKRCLRCQQRHERSRGKSAPAIS